VPPSRLDRGADPPGAAPWTVRLAAGLGLAQAVGTAGFAVRFVADVVPLEEPLAVHGGYALGVVVFVVGAAAALALAARALLRLRPWARSLLVVAQVMALAIGAPMAQAGDWVGWLIAATGAAGFILLLHPATTAALERADHRG
jgi:hypothetical protein